ncbi:nuclear transport factor 2 family protein [Pseudonocardia pini]|uniref:nuclear transport factor 2 family protein n=1 Tax=Pseudonocardia pini TaxID=2758030 RepID=UPI0015F08EB5|nr:nuclear transport factor 2 family protein [Pseudonocardia pini]
MEDNDISNDLTRTFVSALRGAEQDSDVEGLAALFTEDAELFRLDGEGTRRGDARTFWTQYRDQFGDVSTTFSNAVETEGEAALEWESTGTRPDGRPFRYQGSTFLSLGEDRITGLRTYYDTAAFVDIPAGTR